MPEIGENGYFPPYFSIYSHGHDRQNSETDRGDKNKNLKETYCRIRSKLEFIRT